MNQVMVTASNRQRKCSKCSIELVNPTGVHMGIPFGHWTTMGGFAPSTKIIVCGKCYDAITVDDHKVQQRTGEDVI